MTLNIGWGITTLVIVIKTFAENGSSLMASLNEAYSVTISMWYLNSAVNFYMYCLGGPLFRRELKALFRRGNSIGNTDTAWERSTVCGNFLGYLKYFIKIVHMVWMKTVGAFVKARCVYSEWYLCCVEYFVQWVWPCRWNALLIKCRRVYIYCVVCLFMLCSKYTQ